MREMREQFDFRPGGPTEEAEEYEFDLQSVSAIQMRIVPNIDGHPAVARVSDVLTANSINQSQEFHRGQYLTHSRTRTRSHCNIRRHSRDASRQMPGVWVESGRDACERDHR